ncbi:hypothetical protein ABKN59_007301 [Abortiporus biennis]
MSSTVSSPTMSPATAYTNIFSVAPTSAFSAQTEVDQVNELVAAMQASLGNLGKMFDTVQQEAARVIQVGGEMQTAEHIKKIRKDLSEQDKKQQQNIEEIKKLLQQELDFEIINHLKTLVEAGIMEQIDEIVKEQVAEELPKFFPKELQEEVEHYRQELEQAQQALHNSESRLANSVLRSTNLKEPIHTIYKSDGTISEIFPRDVNSLFNMDTETSQRLMEEYGLEDISQSRERNLNRFMQFCGIGYQLVPTSASSPILYRTKTAGSNNVGIVL